MSIDVLPRVIDVFVDGNLVERRRVELSHRDPQEGEVEEGYSVYDETGDWICDCPNKDAADALKYAILLFSDTTVRGLSREGWARILEKRAEFFLSEARIARAQIPAEQVR